LPQNTMQEWIQDSVTRNSPQNNIRFAGILTLEL